MATKTIWTGNATEIFIVYGTSVNASAFTSTTTATAYWKKTTSGAIGYKNSPVTFSLTVGGNKKDYAWTYDLRNVAIGGTRKITSHSFTVNHSKTTGKAVNQTISVSADGGTLTFPKISGAFTVVPPTISVTPTVPPALSSHGLYTNATTRTYWQASKDPAGGTVTYQLQRAYNNGGYSTIYTGTALEYYNTLGVWDNVSYRIRASAGREWSAYRTWESFKSVVKDTPTVPPSLSVPTIYSGESNTISWGTSTVTGPTPKYTLHVSYNGAPSVLLIDRTSVKSFSHVVPYTANTVKYTIRAVGDGSFSEGRVSALINVKHPAPTNPGALSIPSLETYSYYTVSWGKSTDPRGKSIVYDVEASFGGGAYERVVTDTSSTSYRLYTSSYSSVRVRVRAWNGENLSSWVYSTTRSIYNPTPPSTPTSISIPTKIEVNKSFTVSWGAGSLATSYYLYRSLDGGAFTSVANTDSSTRSYVDSVPTGTKNVTYRVRSYNYDGYSGYRTSIERAIYIPRPPYSSASITIPSTIKINENFTVEWDSASYTDTYYLYRSINGGTYEHVINTSSTSRVDSVPSGTVNVSYRVRGYNIDGYSSYTTSKTVTIYVPVPPLTPTSIYVPSEIRGGKSFTVSWGDSTHAYMYYLERAVNGGSYSSIESTTTTSYVDTLPKGTQSVVYRVRGYNSDGYSSYRTSSRVYVKNFPEIQTKQGGVLKTSTDGWVKVGGVLRSIDTIYIKVGGVVKEL